MDRLIWLDHLLFQKINSGATHPLLDSFFSHWTDIHKTLPFQIIVAAVLLWLIETKKWRVIVLILFAVLVGTLVDFVNGQLLKPIFERPRPSNSELPFAVILRGPAYGGLAFPSSHAATSFAIATFLAFHLKKFALFLLAFAVLTAYSRVYCGVHFPSDIIVGAAFGTLSGLVVHRATNWL